MGLHGRGKILVVNPGSTSTRVSLFEDGQEVSGAILPAPAVDFGSDLWDEFPLRLSTIREWLLGENLRLGDLNAVVGRGGLFRPVAGGAYEVNEAMLADARGNRQGKHASNLGCALARALADEAEREGGGAVLALVVDPVSTDEFEDVARISGLREIPRVSLSHALSIHAVVHQLCRRGHQPIEGTRFVVAHLGGGISVCPVLNGKIIDANNANSGGPFSPTRAGGLPTQELMALCFSGKFTLGELMEMTVKKGGLLSYLGTDDGREIERRIENGDEEAALVYGAMAYQIAKEIGAMATVLRGDVQKILLTGGLTGSALLVGSISERVGSIAPVEVCPVVEEMEALALGAVRVLNGEAQMKEY
jgi:butyrate kinase